MAGLLVYLYTVNEDCIDTKPHNIIVLLCGMAGASSAVRIRQG
jgi:hypothetical protein